MTPETKTLFHDASEPGLDNLAFDKDGTLYVSNADFGWIIEILPNRQTRTISKGGMIGPMGVAVLPGAGKTGIRCLSATYSGCREFDGLTGNEERRL